MRTLTILFVIILVGLSIGKEIEKDFEDDYILPITDEDEKCKGNWENYEDGKDVPLPSLFAMKRSRNPRNFHLTRNMPCSCEMEHKVVDLGSSYFPRYIPSAVCKQGRCRGGPYRCHQKHYRVRVLKQKEMEEPDSIETLPESLKDFWIVKSISVTVGCECAP